jgi:uncharacterized protein
MIVQFSTQNYKAFKEEAKLTMFATNYDKHTREQENIQDMPKFGLRLLKSAVMYGANASGKSKLIEALLTMQKIVIGRQMEDNENIEPFLLSTETENEPTAFEITFIDNNEMFRFGFEIKKGLICSEWLYHRPNTKEVEMYYREFQEFNTHPLKFKKGSLVVKEELVRPDTLLLTVATRFNDETAKKVTNWFRRLSIGLNWDDDKLTDSSILRADGRVELRERALEMLQNADIGIENILPIIKKPDYKPYGMVSEPEMQYGYGYNKVDATRNVREKDAPDLITEHKKYNEKNELVGTVDFSLEYNESEGTKKYFAYAVPIIEALSHGTVLVIDELDAKLHPNLVQKIVELFNSKEQNPLNAQLIFNTHDTNLLGAGLFRRDQIWFIEKNRYGAASLYSLASFKTDEGARKNDNFEEKYVTGRYGGIPILGDFNTLKLALKNE